MISKAERIIRDHETTLFSVREDCVPVLEWLVKRVKELEGTDGEYGCHVDLEEGMKPDSCVIDDGVPENCVYAVSLLRQGKTKFDCQYWKPIKFTSGALPHADQC